MAPRPRVVRVPHGPAAAFLGPLVLGLAIAAPAARAQQPQPASADQKGSQSITVEGCLTKQGNAQRSSAAEQFVLTLNAPATSGPPAAPGSTTSPAQTAPAPTSPPSGGAVPAPPQKKMYALRSAPEAPRSLNTMVNHHVRITGTTTDGATTAPLAGRSPEATPYQAPVSAPGQTSGATGTPFDATNLPTLVVHSITSVASKCR